MKLRRIEPKWNKNKKKNTQRRLSIKSNRNGQWTSMGNWDSATPHSRKQTRALTATRRVAIIMFFAKRKNLCRVRTPRNHFHSISFFREFFSAIEMANDFFSFVAEKMSPEPFRQTAKRFHEK